MSDWSNFPNPDSDRDMLLIGAVFVVLGAWLWATYASPWRWAGLAALLLGLAGIVAVIKRRRRGTRDDFEAPSPLPTEVALQVTKTPVLDRADAAELSPEGLAQLEAMLDLLHEAGVLAPERPAAEHLAEAMADRGEPVTLQDLPAALEEAVAWRPEFELSRYTRNLAFHSEQVEQHEEALIEQIDDLARLSGGSLDVRELDMGPWTSGTVPVRLRVQVGGGGTEVRIDEAFWSKALNLPMFQRLAAALRTAGAPRRLAGLYSEQGLWITSFATPTTDLAALNHALGVSGEEGVDEGWCWLDELPADG